MKIAILQADIIWNSPEKNIKRLEEMMDNSEQADLYVLPEMFTTGFATDPRGVAEKIEGEGLKWMKRKAVDKGCAIAGSIATEDNGCFFNRFYFVHPDGNIETYDKKHLFSYGKEDHFYTAGSRREVVTYRGVRILLQICYDLRFPIWSRNRKDYDVSIYVASWPSSRIDVWNTLLRARAIENQSYVVGVNRVGEDPISSYSGGSMIIDPKGKILISCEENTAETRVAKIDMEELQSFRRKFPALDDADLFSIT